MKKIHKTLSVESAVKKVKKGNIALNHRLQRREGAWNKKNASLLIDSILRDYIVPDIYTIVEPDNKRYVIDGVQRLSTFRNFIDGKFSLSDGLEPITINGVEYEISKKKFSKLDEKIQDLIKDFNIDIYEITEYSDKEVREMFSRLNSGKQLNSTQKLTALMTDEVSDNILMLSNNEVFEKMLTPANLKSSVDIAIIIETMMLIETQNGEFLSYKSSDKGKFIYYLNDNINDDKVSKLDDAFTDLNVFLENNEDIKLLKTSIPMIVYAFYKAKKDHKSVEKLSEKVKDFAKSYDMNAEYKEKVASGTSGSDSVKYRYDYWKKIVNSL